MFYIKHFFAIKITNTKTFLFKNKYLKWSFSFRWLTLAMSFHRQMFLSSILIFKVKKVTFIIFYILLEKLKIRFKIQIHEHFSIRFITFTHSRLCLRLFERQHESHVIMRESYCWSWICCRCRDIKQLTYLTTVLRKKKDSNSWIVKERKS